MLTSITPLGERGRANRWGVTTTAYVATSALSGALAGLLLGLAGAAIGPSSRVALAVFAAVALAAALLDAAGRRPWSWRRQVDDGWMRTYRGWVYGAGFGGQLGVGVVTIVTSATVYAALAADVLVASAWAGAVLGLAFGLGRALPLLLAGHVRTSAQLAALHRRVALAAPRARWASVAVAALAAAGAIAGAAW